MKMYRLAAHTYRDKIKANSVVLYHASPDKLSQLMPRSKFLKSGKTGLFLSPSYKSVISDWASYVMGKKHNQHPLTLKRQQLTIEKNQLEELPQTNEITAKIEKIDAMIDKINETTKSENKAYWDSVSGYKTIFIHTVRCPKDIYERARQFMNGEYEADSENDAKLFGFWMWGSQVFIVEEDLPNLQIVDVKELSLSDFIKEYKDVSVNRYLDEPSKNVKREWKRDDEEYRRKKREEKEPSDPNRYDHSEKIKQQRKDWEEYLQRQKDEKDEKQNI